MKFDEQVTPRVVGSMPSDGADGIIRTAFIAVGLDVGDEGIGVDIETVTEENIKLYPKDDPDSPIKSFLNSSQIPLNITIEPLHALAPNTTYIFEITDSLKDLSGRSFPPYKITFTTSEITQRKFISMKRPKPKRIKGFRPKNDPNILPAGPKLYAEPTAEPILAQAEVQEAVEEVTPKKETVAERKAREKEEQAAQIEAMLAAQRAKAEAATVSAPPKETLTPTTEAVAKPAMSAAPTASTEPATPAISTPSKTPKNPTPAPTTPTTATATTTTASATPPPIPKTESVDFPKARIQSGGKLPIRFVMLEKKSVKYMIKNPAGKIVKRGANTISAGPSGKGIDVSTLAAGRYRISVKVEDKIVHHTFVILE